MCDISDFRFFWKREDVGLETLVFTNIYESSGGEKRFFSQRTTESLGDFSYKKTPRSKMLAEKRAKTTPQKSVSTSNF